MAYVTHLASTISLPLQKEGELGQAHQPPLYYALAALVVRGVDRSDHSGHFHFNRNLLWAGNGGSDVNVALHSDDERFPYRGEALALHLARCVSIVAGTTAVVLTLLVGWTIFPRRREIGLLAAALTAFNPQFLFLSAAVNNDTLVAAACSASILAILRALNAGESTAPWLWTAICLSAALLVKLSALPVTALAFIALIMLAHQRRSLRFFATRLVAMGLVMTIATGWWFWRNYVLYGDLLGFRTYRVVFASLRRTEPLHWSDLSEFVSTQFRSYWGVFGWMNLPAPEWFHWSTVALVALAAGGILVAFASRQRKVITETQRRGLAMLSFAVLFQEAFTLLGIRNFNSAWYQGRYLFPAVAPIAALLAFGLVRWFDLLFTRGGVRVATASLALILASVSILAPTRWILPAYERGKSTSRAGEGASGTGSAPGLHQNPADDVAAGASSHPPSH